MYVLNGLQDQTAMYVIGNIYTFFLQSNILEMDACTVYREIMPNFSTVVLSNQPVHWLFYYLFLSVVGWKFIFIYALMTTSILLAFSSFIFKKYNYWTVYSLIMTFSSFYWIKLGIHQELMHIWVNVSFLFFVRRLVGEGTAKFNSYASIILILVFSTLISNYFGFVLFVTFGVFILSGLIFKPRAESKDLIKLFLLSLFISTCFLGLILAPHIKNIYIERLGGFSWDRNHVRPYEDFVTFSLRPWYFLIPSPKNPVYGQFSQAITQKIESTGYFLADDYFPAEHSAAFFGYLFLITFAATLIYGYKKLNPETKQKVNTLLLTTIILISFAMPPYFTISGLKIYTPGHLIAVFFPMFRVTARFSPMILLLMLLIMAEIINVIHVYKPKFFKIFMPILLVVTLVETFVPFKITKYDKVPDPYVYMGTQQPMSIKYLVYPYSKSNESFFWLPDHKQCLMNVRGYNYENISAEELTLKLFEPGTLDQAKELGATHILFYEADKYSDQISSLNSLELVQQFSDSVLYKIN